MQAQRGRQFIGDHSLMSLAILAVLVSGVAVFITLGLTGELPTFREDADQSVVAVPASASIPQDRAEIGAGDPRQMSLGSAYHPSLGEGQMKGSAVVPDQSTTVTNRGAEVRLRGITGPGEGLKTHGFAVEDAQLPEVRSSIAGPGEGLNDYRFVEENTQLPGVLQSSIAGPGEGLNDYRFVEESSQITGAQRGSADGLPGGQATGEGGY